MSTASAPRPDQPTDLDPHDTSGCPAPTRCIGCDATRDVALTTVVRAGYLLCIGLCPTCSAGDPVDVSTMTAVAGGSAHAGHLGVSLAQLAVMGAVRSHGDVASLLDGPGLADVPSGPFDQPPSDLRWTLSGGRHGVEPDPEHTVAWLTAACCRAGALLGAADLEAWRQVAALGPEVAQSIAGTLVRAVGRPVDVTRDQGASQAEALGSGQLATLEDHIVRAPDPLEPPLPDPLEPPGGIAALLAQLDAERRAEDMAAAWELYQARRGTQGAPDTGTDAP